MEQRDLGQRQAILRERLKLVFEMHAYVASLCYNGDMVYSRTMSFRQALDSAPAGRASGMAHVVSAA